MIIAALFASSFVSFASTAQAQDNEPSPLDDPQAWRPIIYADLSTVTPDNAAYAELWAQDLAANDKSYGPSASQPGGHAPATESHMVVRGTDKVAVVSILNTVTGCTSKHYDASANVSVKLCPLKIAIYAGNQVTVTSGRKGCILETVDPTKSLQAGGTFVAYDPKGRSFRLGTLINHEAVPGCSANIPLQEKLLP